MEKERISSPQMEYYRYVYYFSKRWNGKDSLFGKNVIIYCEQGYGDIIQMMRYIPKLKETGCNVILHAPVALHPVLGCLDVELFDKTDPRLPTHDYHILSLSLPFLLDTLEISPKPYLTYDNKAELEGVEKIGIAWEGSPAHPKNTDRCCPLKHFGLLLRPGTMLYMLQDKVYSPFFVEGVDFDVYSIPVKDFGDTASMINAVDFVVTVDTAVLHLAGAMGKRVYGLLHNDPDPRWAVGKWYENVTLLQGDWANSFAILASCRKNYGIQEMD